MSLLLLILGLILFVGLVVVHEYGHFIAARRNGVEVEEFGIGFPPRAISKKMRGGYILSLNWLPLGGFVKLKGEHDEDSGPGSFGAASLRTKVKIMVAGVAMNLLAAFVLLTFLALVGMPKLLDNQFSVPRDTKVVRREVLAGYIEPGSPANKAGLQPEDRLLAYGTQGCATTVCTPLSSSEELRQATMSHAGQEVRIEYQRQGKILFATTTLRSRDEVETSKKTATPKGYLGVAPTEFVIQRATWSASIMAGGVIGQFTAATYKGLWSALSNLFQGHTAQASEQVSGPVGIFVILKDGSLLGYQFILMIVAIISLTLAIMNVLPIPALDGGRLFVLVLFRALRRPLHSRTEEWIHGTGFALLMVLILLITIVDIRRFF